MLLSLITLTWLTVMACVVAVCQLTKDDDESGVVTVRPYDQYEVNADDHWTELAPPTELSSARPHCESRMHRTNASLRFQPWRGRTRKQRVGTRNRCHCAPCTCESLRRAV